MNAATPHHDAATLARALALQGHLPGPVDTGGPQGPGTQVERPWFLSLLLGFSGWVAGLFGLAVLDLSVRPSQASWPLLGASLIGAAWALLRTVHTDNLFGRQLGLVLSFTGQATLIGGLPEFGLDDDAGMAFACAALQAVLALAMPDRLHRSVSTLLACAAWAVALRLVLWQKQFSFLFSHERPQATPGVQLSAWMFTWLPVGALLLALLRTEARWMAAGKAGMARPLCTGLVVALGWATLVSAPLEEMTWSASHARHDAVWLLLSLLVCVGALVAAFALRSPGLMGACIVAGLAYLGLFYYALDVSLLAKSLLMLAAGVAALVAARRLQAGEARP